MKSKIPAIYKPCKGRNVTPVDDGQIGIGFDLDAGESVRLRMEVKEAVSMAKAIIEFSKR